MQEYKDAIHYLEAVAKGNPLEFAKGASPICKQICFGVLRDYYRLVYFRDSLLKKKLPAKHLDLNLLLLCGIYSICHLNRPAHASVNAVVEVTVMLKKPWAKGLVNAVMRNFQRQQKTLQGESGEMKMIDDSHRGTSPGGHEHICRRTRPRPHP